MSQPAPPSATPATARASLWRHGDFNRLWAGQTVSVVGSAVTQLALPTLAVLQLHAGPFQVGLLAACQRFAFPVLALPVGVLADRLSRRRLMLGADLARCLLLGAIPLVSALGALQLWHLYAIAALTGGCTAVFDVAYLAYLPALVGRDDLADANQRLELTFSTGDLAGPGLGGLLVQLAGAARAMAVDAGSFLFSAFMLLLIGRHEPPRPRRELPPFSLEQMRREIGEGLRVVMRDPILRSLVLGLGVLVFLAHGIDAVLVVFAYRTLHLTPGLFGLVLTSTGVGALGGVAVVGPLRRRIGVGHLITWCSVVIGLTMAVIPLAVLGAPVALLFSLGLVRGAAGTAQNVTQVTLRMLATPDRLHARMNAVFRMIYWGAWPLGELGGGALAGAPGLVPTIALGGAGCVVAGAAMGFTAVGRLRAFPEDPG